MRRSQGARLAGDREATNLLKLKEVVQGQAGKAPLPTDPAGPREKAQPWCPRTTEGDPAGPREKAQPWCLRTMEGRHWKGRRNLRDQGWTRRGVNDSRRISRSPCPVDISNGVT